MRFYQIGHCGPIGAICFILWITITAWNCLVQWFPPNVDDLFSMINVVVFWLWFALIFYQFFRTISIGPGFVPKNWQPKRKQDEKYLEFCKICSNFKVPRSHHCRTCHRCILKLDHHCPWMNICIGYFNQIHFCCFLIYSILGSIHALLMICPCIYRVLFVPYYPYTWQRNQQPIIRFTSFSLLASILSIGLSIGVIIAVGFLLIIQLRNMLYNQTTIEYWIVRRAYQRNPSFIYPYDLGFKQNCLQLFKSIDEDFQWPVRSNCHRYTLTCEQLEQKFELNQQSVRYKIIHDYSGSLNIDLHTCFKLNRLAVKKDDYIRVTHWESFWLYGRSETSAGWFPRSCIDET